MFKCHPVAEVVLLVINQRKSIETLQRRLRPAARVAVAAEVIGAAAETEETIYAWASIFSFFN